MMKKLRDYFARCLVKFEPQRQGETKGDKCGRCVGLAEVANCASIIASRNAWLEVKHLIKENLDYSKSDVALILELAETMADEYNSELELFNQNIKKKHGRN